LKCLANMVVGKRVAIIDRLTFSILYYKTFEKTVSLISKVVFVDVSFIPYLDSTLSIKGDIPCISKIMWNSTRLTHIPFESEHYIYLQCLFSHVLEYFLVHNKST
jgi:hypothetical protein